MRRNNLLKVIIFLLMFYGFLFSNQAFANDTQNLYLLRSSGNTNKVNIINGTTTELSNAGSGYTTFNGMVMSKDGQNLYLLRSSGHTYKLNMSTGKTTELSNLGTGYSTFNGMVISPDGQYLYLLRSSGNTNKVNISTGVTTELSNAGSGYTTFNGMLISPDGQYLYLLRTSGHTYKVNISTGVTTELSNAGSGYTTFNGMVISSDGQYLYLLRSSGHTHKVTISTGKTTELSNLGSGYSTFNGMVISPDGQYLYLLRSSGNTNKVNISTGKTTELSNAGSGITTFNGMVISPDGQYLYLLRSSGYTNKVNISTGVTTELSNAGSGYTTFNGMVFFSNISPTISPISPNVNSNFSEITGYNTMMISGTIYDPNVGNKETIYYRIDGSAGQAGTQLGSTLTADGTNQSYSGSINISALSEGTHTLYMWVQDWCLEKSPEVSITFKVDKSLPVINSLSVTSTYNSITMSGLVTDALSGLNPSPYRYTVGSNVTGWLTINSYTQNLLTPNTSYTVQLEARDQVGHTVSSSQTIYTKAQVPNITAGNPTWSTLDVTLSDSNPAGTLYQITSGSNYVSQTGTLTATPTWINLTNKKVTVTGLNPSNTYSFIAYAKNSAGTVTAASAPASGTTLVAPPAVPVNLTSTATTNTITISWPAVTGAATYSINIDNGASILNNYPSSNYTHTGLTPGVQHTYSVKAVNAGGASNWSLPLTAATMLNIPGNITATSSETSITLSWDAVSNANGYDVKVDGIYTSTSNTTITVGGLGAGGQHTYSVRSKNSVSTSNWSEQQNKSTRLMIPDIPAGLSGGPTNSSISLSWNPTPDATTYQISSDGNIINSGSGTSYTDTGLDPGTEHTYMVRAVNSGGKSGWSAPIKVSTIPLEPNVPANLSANVTALNILVGWDTVENASGYDLEIYVLNQNIAEYVYGQSVTEAVYNIHVTANDYNQIVAPGCVYTFKVRSVVEGTASEWSPAISVTPGGTPDGVPRNISAVVEDTSVSLIWDSVSNAKSYDIEENGTVVGNVRAVSYTRDDRTPNTEYSYRIRAVNNTGTGDWSEPVTIMTLDVSPLGIPGNIIATPAVNTINLIWDSVDGATGYELDIDQNISLTVTGSVYALSNLEPNTEHTFRIRAVKENVQGPWSGLLTATTLSDLPTTPVTGSTNASYTVSVSEGEVYTLVLTVSELQDLSHTKFNITYNSDQLSIEDLCTTTPQMDIATGSIGGTDLSVVQLMPGSAVFTMDTPVNQGQSFTGLVTTIAFKAKMSGRTVITYSIDQGGAI